MLDADYLKVDLKLFGQELRRFRNSRGLSQAQLAEKMGLFPTAASTISDYERGIKRPEVETIRIMAKALSLSHADTHYLCGLAGYVPLSRYPCFQEIRNYLTVISQYIAKRPYPAFITDHRFNFWSANYATAPLIGHSIPQLRDLISQYVSVFDVLFDSRLGVRSHFDVATLKSFEQDQVYRFKAYNLFRRHEPFYLNYLERMKTRLSPNDFDNFLEAWNAVTDGRVQDVQKPFPFTSRVNFEVNSHAIPFHVFEHNILQLVMFDVVIYEPAHDSLKAPLTADAGYGSVNVWDYTDDIQKLELEC